jgi:hypothetical protein
VLLKPCSGQHFIISVKRWWQLRLMEYSAFGFSGRLGLKCLNHKVAEFMFCERPHINRYFEPLFGGGALFFAIKPNEAYLSDKNSDLMHAYSQVRDQPEAVIRA